MIYVLIPTTVDRRERLAKCVDALRASVCSEPFTICTYENKDGGFIAAIHKMLEGIDDNSLVFCIGDDVIVDKTCLHRLYEAYTNAPRTKMMQGVVCQPYDEFHNGAIVVNPFCQAWVMKRYQYKGYIHNYADVEFTEIIKERKMYLYVPDAIVEHVHHINNKAEFDQTYKDCSKFLDHDRGLYQSRKAAGFKPFNS